MTSCVLRNLSPTSSLSTTPLEQWTGRRPSVHHLRVVGCKAFCQFDKIQRTEKFSAKAWIGVLVGCSIDTSEYKVWDQMTHKVWDVCAPDFDESVSGGWWRKPTAVDKPTWGGEEPLHFEYVEDPPADPLVE